MNKINILQTINAKLFHDLATDAHNVYNFSKFLSENVINAEQSDLISHINSSSSSISSKLCFYRIAYSNSDDLDAELDLDYYYSVLEKFFLDTDYKLQINKDDLQNFDKIRIDQAKLVMVSIHLLSSANMFLGNMDLSVSESFNTIIIKSSVSKFMARKIELYKNIELGENFENVTLDNCYQKYLAILIAQQNYTLSVLYDEKDCIIIYKISKSN